MKNNKYYIRARLYPTILTCIPVLFLFIKIVAPLYSNLLSPVFSVLPAVTSAAFSAAIIFLLVQLNRVTAKEIFQRLYFKDEMNMPTTNHLLWGNDFFEKEIKQKIRRRIKDKFSVSLLSEQEENSDETKARKLIVTAVSQIRNSLRDNKLLLQHNIEYGFFRNLVGGSVIALLFSIVLLVFAIIEKQTEVTMLSVVFMIVYLLPILFSKFFINKYGNYYSKILYEQFLTI